ncbi:MAG: type II secretion system protein [bacterium]|nr:type II secretion system protein [bacterium]
MSIKKLMSIKKNNKGFTLIELLAVIVILGVLMIIAVPMVTKYIKQAKQDAFVDTAKAYINSARYGYLNGDYTNPEDPKGNCDTLDSGTGGTIYIKFRYIEVDKTGGKSSFNKTIEQDKSYVKIKSTENGQYIYSVYMIDDGGNAINETEEKNLTRTSVVTNGTSNIVPASACKHDTYDYLPKQS